MYFGFGMWYLGVFLKFKFSHPQLNKSEIEIPKSEIKNASRI
jgi:hypothetical protein